MRVRIEIDTQLNEEEVVIRCAELTPDIANLQRVISGTGATGGTRLVAYKGEKQCFPEIKEFLFFETGAQGMMAHTKDEIFTVPYKLYELEELLPPYFFRVSKSTIANVAQIYGITRNVTGASLVEFRNCHKQIYVSRNYYKALQDKIAEAGLS